MALAVTDIIFDLDGTLIDSKPGILESYRHAAERVMPGKKYDAAAVIVGPPLPAMFKKSFPESTPSEVESLVKTFREHYAKEGLFKTKWYEGVSETLPRLRARGISLYIATNKPLRLTQAILDYIKLMQHFREVLSLDSVTPPFPNKPAILGQLIATHKIDLATALYVGDTAEDASAAAEFNLRFVWAAYGYGKLIQKENQTPFKICKRFSELEVIWDETLKR